MNRIHSLRRIAAIALVVMSLCAGTARADVFYNKAIQLASEIISNPAGFFFDFQQDMESINPVMAGKRLGFNWHIGQFLLLPVPDPTFLNLSGKFKLHPEGHWLPGLPQMDLIGGFWDAGPLLKPLIDKNAQTQEENPNVDTKIKDAKFKGHFISFMMTSSVEPRVRLFLGWKYSKMSAELGLNRDQDLIGTAVRSFKVGYNDHFLTAGIEHVYGTNKWWIAQLSYGLGENSIASKISWYRKNFELGLNVYPEGVFVIHPVLNWHINF